MRIVRKAARGTTDRPHVLCLTFRTKALIALSQVLSLELGYVDIVRRPRRRASHIHSPKSVQMMIGIINGVVY
jgi:hypothetical protein